VCSNELSRKNIPWVELEPIGMVVSTAMKHALIYQMIVLPRMSIWIILYSPFGSQPAGFCQWSVIMASRLGDRRARVER
jgi:hypothetical protein